MALNDELKKKIADKLATRTPEQKLQSKQSSQQNLLREQVGRVLQKNQTKIAPNVSPLSAPDLTTRIPFTNVKAPLGGDNMLGSFARLSNNIFTSVVESTVVGVLRGISSVTPGGIKTPVDFYADVSLGGDNLQRIEGKVPSYSEAALKRQAQLDKERPNSPFINTLQAASEEIFLPLWDAVPILGGALRTSIKGLRSLGTSSLAKQAFIDIGFKPSADKEITETAIKTSVKKTAQQNITDLKSGKITPEDYLQKQANLSRAVDTINGGETKFGRIGESLNNIANSLTKERSFRNTTVVKNTDGIPVITRATAEPITQTESLLSQQNKALRGELEDSRLSNAQVLSDTIKSEKIKPETTAESNIDIFTIGNRQLKPGARVSLDRETARGILGNSPRQSTVKADDLIKLDDGTFVFVPKKLVDTGTDAISTLHKSVRSQVLERVKVIEKQKATEQALQKAKLTQDAQEAARVAKEDDVRVARETSQKELAQKTIKQAPIDLAKRRANIDVQIARDATQIKSVEKIAKAEVKSAIQSSRAAAKVTKTAETKVKTVMKAIAKAKKEGRATARLTQALNKAKADFKNAKKVERSTQTVIKNAAKKVPNDTKVKLAELKSVADIKKAKVVEETKKAINDAKATIKELTTVPKSGGQSVRQAERLQNKITKLENTKTKLIETYGRIEEVPEAKLQTIDNAIEKLKSGVDEISPTNGGKETQGSIKQTSKETITEVKTTTKPVKIEGTDTNVSTLMKKLSKDLKSVPDSPEFNVATHAKQTENALNHIAKHGIDDTLTLLESGKLPVDTTRAATVSSLLESINEVTDPLLKMNYIDRLLKYIPELSETSTRAGQEIEALKILHKDNPIYRIMQIQKSLNSEKNVKRVADEIAKLESRLEKIDSKGIISSKIDDLTC